MPETKNTTGDIQNEDSRTESEQAGATTYTPFTEEQLRATTVGELVPLAAPIQIVDYDPEWPKLYERTKRELASNNWKYMQNYADAKTSVVQEILTRAQRNEESTPPGEQ